MITITGNRDHHRLEHLITIPGMRTKQAAVPLTEAFDQRRRELSPGTVLTRDWNGHQHRVAVIDGGFSWDGSSYKSLSEVAKAITGTKWNGPRFFGLRDKKLKGASL